MTAENAISLADSLLPYLRDRFKRHPEYIGMAYIFILKAIRLGMNPSRVTEEFDKMFGDIK